MSAELCSFSTRWWTVNIHVKQGLTQVLTSFLKNVLSLLQCPDNFVPEILEFHTIQDWRDTSDLELLAKSMWCRLAASVVKSLNMLLKSSSYLCHVKGWCTFRSLLLIKREHVGPCSFEVSFLPGDGYLHYTYATSYKASTLINI